MSRPAARSIRVSALLAILAIALSLGRHLPFEDDPFVQGMEAMIGACYEGRIQQNYEVDGLLAMRGAPIIGTLPTRPPWYDPYINHPPMHHWLTYVWVSALGNTEAGLRAGPTAWCALAAGVLAWMACRARGVVAGLAAGIVFAAMPMAFVYGRMPSWSSLALLLGLVLTGLVGRDAPSPRRLTAVAVLTFVGAACSWLGVLMAPMLWLYDALVRRARPDLRLGLVLAGATGAALAMYAGLALWWAGLDWVVDTLSSVGGSVRQVGLGPLAFLGTQVEHVASLFGWPGALVGAAGVLVAASTRGRAGELPAQLLFWTAMCLLHVVIAPARAVNHEFWWYAFLPVVVLSVSALVAWLWRAAPGRRPLVGRTAALLVLVAVAGEGVRATVAHRAEDLAGDPTPPMLQLVDRVTDPDDFVVACLPPAPWMYYVESWMVFGYFDPDHYLRDLRLFQAGEFRTRRLVFLMPGALLARFRDDLGRDLVGELVAEGMQHVRADPPETPLHVFLAGP